VEGFAFAKDGGLQEMQHSEKFRILALEGLI
jgi:hypothetical protein